MVGFECAGRRARPLASVGQKWGKPSAILCPSMPFWLLAGRYKKAPKPFVYGALALFCVNTPAQSGCVSEPCMPLLIPVMQYAKLHPDCVQMHLYSPIHEEFHGEMVRVLFHILAFSLQWRVYPPRL